MPSFLVDTSAPAYARRSRVMPAPRDLVWSILTDLSHWSDWNAGVRNMRLDGPVAPGTGFRWNGGGLPIRSRIEIFRPTAEIGWTGRAPGIRARHVWHLTEEAHGTRVTTEEDFAGPLASLMPRMMARTIGEALDQGLGALEAECIRRLAAQNASGLASRAM
ncbi:SRPBCC family protein [Roseibacterium sp. SDUM158016]|uniref:SRPBCC family protein n=1 Tax=Roseicyclus sediminis TaxID=2980997 RepID=UPI0021CEE7D0|nr:SRPBCC family protein [Roseibacterium sp. SDUM158016]MCU4653151.1 SRPBCC family protein [Roseibacterium sp. SDUM158016]